MLSNNALFLISLFLTFQSIFIPSSCQTNATELQALLAFKDAIASDPLQALKSWNKSAHFCSWRGVVCGRKHGDRVVSIILNSQGLTGSLSPYIGNLSFLKRINLENNTFTGQIPEEIGRLRRLGYLELSNNSFEGKIPKNLSQCQNLYYLALFENKLIGSITPEIGSLVNLQSLGLTSNRFSGSIPHWIGNLTSLIQLSLADCDLKGQIPESLVQLRNLRLLVLEENRLIGNIPKKLFNSSKLFFFSVAANQLRGGIPLDIGYTLPNIRFLSLAYNNFSGEIPSSLSNASSIKVIQLNLNQFRGPMLRNFGSLANLQILNLYSNRIHGDISFISSLTNCTKLSVLELGRNLLNGTLPNSIANLSLTVTHLFLDENDIHGRVPSGIGCLHNLSILILNNNHLSGPIPSSIGKLVNLEQLSLASNIFTGSFPPSLGNLTLLSILDLGGNDISGTIPPSFISLQNLLLLDLSHNNLNGPLPEQVLSLSSISIYFDISYNALTGPIPQEVRLLRNLGILDLSKNQLSGSIPNAISSCVSLEHLHLEGNSFEGEIPVGLSTLKGLQDVDLSRNHLSGSIPRFLAELNLSNLNLSFNNLSGEVPTFGVFLNKSAIFIDGNVDLCGGIHELGLQSCPILNHKSKNAAKLLKVILPIVFLGVLFLAIVVSFGVFIYRRKVTTSRQSSEEKFMRITYAGLLKSTNGFSNANLIGVGRFGSVYKATLDDGETIVAVKVLNLNVGGASKTFIAECNALKWIRHRNLVKLLRVCVSTDFQGHDFKALVYDYKSNGSLEEWLHPNANEDNENRSRNLTLIQRLNIAIDIASALEYLHFGTDSIIIHGDLKPSNILLDDEMTAHVGDFGLAKVVMSMSKDVPSNESSSMAIKGTIGYIAPEYGMGDTVSTQGDAYSFGILLLEMFTNIRPTDEAFKDGHFNLHHFVNSASPYNMIDVLDPFLVQEIKVSDHCITMETILKIGVACSNELPRERMAMTDVVTELNKIRSIHLAES